MKRSPNSEQQIFLVAGGIILVLILGVVIVNMVRTPTGDLAEKRAPRPMVTFASREGGPAFGRKSPAARDNGLGLAPIFQNHTGQPVGDPRKISDPERLALRVVKVPEDQGGTRQKQAVDPDAGRQQ